jgi:hypothetical protein
MVESGFDRFAREGKAVKPANPNEPPEHRAETRH